MGRLIENLLNSSFFWALIFCAFNVWVFYYST